MGYYVACPFLTYSNSENGMESILVKSIGLGGDNAKKTTQRSISFNGQDSETKILKSLGSGKIVVEGSISFKKRENGTMVSIINKEDEVQEKALDVPVSTCISSSNVDIEMDDELSLRSIENLCELEAPQSPINVVVKMASPKDEAALKLQKVYKSFRTRRKIADCAVIAEQSWWEVLDFAELKHSSISFFDVEHHETAISRWSRAKTRAAKVGKGLSKSDRAQKLALQHWLEAIDPRHRYGHNLHFYYVKWLQSHCREPFFYWLDIGEGKEVNLEKCPRWKLQQQCIKYLGPMERKAYEIAVENGKLLYVESGELLDTTSAEPSAKWIFVLSTSKTLYVGKKTKGTFQHSSFLAGGATSAAGRLVVNDGVLQAVWPHSGHYKPTEENFQDFISYLKENNMDLTDVKMHPVGEDEPSVLEETQRICSYQYLRTMTSSSEHEFIEELGKDESNDTTTTTVREMNEDSRADTGGAQQEAADVPHERSDPGGGHFGRRLLRKLPKRDELLLKMLQSVNYNVPTPRLIASSRRSPNPTGPGCEVCRVAQAVIKDLGLIVPEESISKRINFHKEAKSYQLGRHLSSKWSSGAGPRIGCVRDYPAELQVMALEQVNLSPRSSVVSSVHLSTTSSLLCSPARYINARRRSPKALITPCTPADPNISHIINSINIIIARLD